MKAGSILNDGELSALVGSVTTAEFAHRLEDEPGLLEFLDSGRYGLGVLHYAAGMGRMDLVQLMLERGLSVDAPSGSGVNEDAGEEEASRFEPGITPLMCAARESQLAAVKYLLGRGADPVRADCYGGPAVHSAAVAGMLPVLNVLLAVGCDPDAECHYRYQSEELGWYWVGTPLHVAAACGKAAVARALIGHGAAIDPITTDGRRPLHYALAPGAKSMVDALMHAGAAPNGADLRYGYTPLYYAAQERHADCVEMLLRGGADRNAMLRNTGDKPIDLARGFYDPELVAIISELLKDERTP